MDDDEREEKSFFFSVITPCHLISNPLIKRDFNG
jgi:hypothetical protein